MTVYSLSRIRWHLWKIRCESVGTQPKQRTIVLSPALPDYHIHIPASLHSYHDFIIFRILFWLVGQSETLLLYSGPIILRPCCSRNAVDGFDLFRSVFAIRAIARFAPSLPTSGISARLPGSQTLRESNCTTCVIAATNLLIFSFYAVIRVAIPRNKFAKQIT